LAVKFLKRGKGIKEEISNKSEEKGIKEATPT
jgi:hypothetical protein